MKKRMKKMAKKAAPSLIARFEERLTGVSFVYFLFVHEFIVLSFIEFMFFIH